MDYSVQKFRKGDRSGGKNEKLIGIVGSGAIGLSFIIVVGAFFETLSLPVDQRLNIVTLFQWIAVAGLNISFSYQVDQLSLVMSLIVTGVGFIHPRLLNRLYAWR